MTVSGSSSSLSSVSSALSAKNTGMVYSVADCEPNKDEESDDEFAAFFRLEGADSPGLITKVSRWSRRSRRSQVAIVKSSVVVPMMKIYPIGLVNMIFVLHYGDRRRD